MKCVYLCIIWGCVSLFLGCLLMSDGNHSPMRLWIWRSIIIVDLVVGSFDIHANRCLFKEKGQFVNPLPVSYTHLTLPTNREV